MSEAIENFKEYSEYLKNPNWLDKDIKKIKSNPKDFQSIEAQSLLISMQEMQSNYTLLTNFQSLSLLTEKVREFGWKNIEKLTIEASQLCEAEGSDPVVCLKKVDEIQIYALSSNLSEQHKAEFVRELKFYRDQQEKLIKFQNSFIEKFNSDVAKLNVQNVKKVVPNKVEMSKSKITTKIISKGPSATLPIVDPRSYGSIFLVSVLMIVFLVGFFYTRKRGIKKKRSAYYGRFFKIQKQSGSKVRIFGNLESDSLKKTSPLSQSLAEVFSRPRTFFGEFHFKFMDNKKIIKIETIFYSKDSLHYYYLETSGKVSSQMKLITASTEEQGGEAIFTTRWSGEGVVESSRLILYLPR